MAKHNELLEGLVRSSQETTEQLLETYFEIVNSNDTISDEKIRDVLSGVSDNLHTMQTVIDHHLRCMKMHK